MKKKFLRVFGRAGTIAGLALTALGFYFWSHFDIGSKVFQLSNDLIGAGIFTVIVSMIVFFGGRQ